MRSPFLLVMVPALVALLSPHGSSPPSFPAADIAVAPFIVEGDSAGVLRAVADSCLERLVRELTARGVGVARHPKLSEKDLHAARPAPWAVLGNVGRDRAQFRAELRLLDVESGDEMRSYFNADEDPQAVANLGAAAAGRIALFIQEQKGPRPGGT